MKLKHKIILLMSCMVLLFGFTGCNSYEDAYKIERSYFGDYFIAIKMWDDLNGNYIIAYAKDTKVKYLIWYTGYKGGITPLYNADGSLQVYEEDKE